MSYTYILEKFRGYINKEQKQESILFLYKK